MNTDELLPCPFCGGNAGLILIGNEFTKKRSAGIECSICHTSQVTGAIHNSLEWCKQKAIEKWNKRVKDDRVDKAIEILGWLTENFFQRMPNGFAKREDENPIGYQRLYTINELSKLYEQYLTALK